MKTHPLYLASAAIALVTGGCVSRPAATPPSIELRARVERLAVVERTNVPRISLQIPDSKADLATESLSVEPLTPAMILRQAGPVGSPAEAIVVSAVAVATPTIVLGGAPVWHGLRQAYGMAVADSAADVAAARATLEAAIAGVQFTPRLHDRVVAELRTKCPAMTLTTSPADADTVLELMAYEPNISGRDGINPGLGLGVGLRVRLLDARTGRELYYDYLDYRGEKYSFVHWARDDARIFHAEFDRCTASLSAEIVAQLFLRAPGEITPRAALAARGIERRPFSFGRSGTFPPPARTPTLYARN